MVAVSITYALVASSWLGQMTVSVMSLEELKITNCEWAQDYTHADLTIKNIGTQGATLSSLQINGEVSKDYEIIEGNLKINPGRSTTIRVNQDFTELEKYEFKFTTKRLTPIKIVSVLQPNLETKNIASIHYVNAISDVDESADKGTHSNFANQQGEPNNVFNTITETDFGTGLTSIVQYPDVGNVNFGTQIDFVNAQDISPDGNYMTLHEENLGGGSNGYPNIRSKTHSVESSSTTSHKVRLPDKIEVGDTLLVVFVCDGPEKITWENEGKDWIVIYEEDAGRSGPTMSIAWKKATGDENSKTVTIQTSGYRESTHISYAIQNANDPYITPPEASPEASGNSNDPDSNGLTPSGGYNPYLWFTFFGSDKGNIATDYPSEYQDNRETYSSSKKGTACAIGAATREFTADFDDPHDFKIKKSYWTATTIVIYPETVLDDYKLDFEYQWTNVDYDETTKQVCIYVETASQDEENLVAYEWNGETWQSLGVLSSDGWNNFTTLLMNGPTYTINIRDEDKPNDATQSSWNIDCIITNCSSTEINYEIDIEVQFTDVDISNNYEQICIYMGSTTAEPLEVYIWNEGTWELLSSNLMQNQWNNMTRTITQNIVTLRFLGSIETIDPIQDSWEIDSVLLYGPP
ncbi:MAG: hypothetical protein NUK63_06795 [Candidatus Bathyarchaeum tardum]|nr:MAG: hypothetical protein NUK63_06795 [Candidatus Bathyarchaeum tardum]